MNKAKVVLVCLVVIACIPLVIDFINNPTQRHYYLKPACGFAFLALVSWQMLGMRLFLSQSSLVWRIVIVEFFILPLFQFPFLKPALLSVISSH